MSLTSKPSLVDAVTGTCAWFFDEVATVVTQTHGPLRAETATFFRTRVDEVLLSRWVTKGRKVTYVHDWRLTNGYDTAARDGLIAWGRDSVKHTEHVWVCLSPDASPFVRIATTTGVGVLKFARMPIDLIDELAPHFAPLERLQPLRF